MDRLIESAMILYILADMGLLGMSRLNMCITISAFQGLLLGVFVLLTNSAALSPRLIVLAVVSMAVKGFVFPMMLRIAVREADVKREVEPFVGFNMSLLIGMVILGFSLWLGGKFQINTGACNPLVLPGSFMTMFTGLFLVVARKQALTQCIGYIVFETGISAFGLAAVGEIPALVELGILLDAFVAVLVMGIAIHRINREFNHIDIDRLSSLKG